MRESLKEYLISIRPTQSGLLCIFSLSIFLPIIVDLFLIYPMVQSGEGFSVTLFMASSHLVILFLALIYHILYFIAKSLFLFLKSKL
jgi:hypothetical protein